MQLVKQNDLIYLTKEEIEEAIAMWLERGHVSMAIVPNTLYVSKMDRPEGSFLARVELR